MLTSIYRVGLSLLIVALFASTSFPAVVTLTWDANTEDDLAGYKVYVKGKSSPLPFTSAPNTVITGTTAITSGLNLLERYLFAVTAYNISGMESSYSNIVEICFLFPPSNVRVSNIAMGIPTKVTIAWDAYTTDPVKRYIVYYGNYSGNSQKFAFSNRTTVVGTTATTSVDPTKKWFYRVTTADDVQESMFSKMVYVRFIRAPINLKFNKVEVR